MAIVFQRPKALLDVPTHYCPGCTHGIIHRLVAECIDELGIEGKTVGIAPVGCAVMAYNYFGCDMIEAPHGRAPAVATGVKRAKPEDLCSPIRATAISPPIDTAETVHSATRGENITVIFVNNAIYGMTGVNGSHLAARSGPSDHALRQNAKDRRLSRQSLRDALHPRRHRLCGARFGRLRQEHKQSEEGY